MYVRDNGVDTGTCTLAAPCKTLPFALLLTTGQRNVVHILSGSYGVGSGADVSDHTAYIDGGGTMLSGSGSGAVLSISNGSISIEDMTVTGSISVTGGTLATYGVSLQNVSVGPGAFEASHSLLNRQVVCTNGGTVTVTSSTVHSGILGSACTSHIELNKFDAAATMLSIDSSFVVQNNTFVSNDSLTDPITLGGTGTFRFNTLVNTSGMDSGANAMQCSGGVTATSNILAWHTSSPVPCAVRYTLLDTLGGTPPGQGNKSADVSTFFVDVAGKDFHLSPGSPAKAMAEPGLDVPVDIEGTTRPSPTGSVPDVGAYEAP